MDARSNAGQPDARVRAVLGPRAMLPENEQVVLAMRPSVWFIVLPRVEILAGLLVIVIGGFWYADASTATGVWCGRAMWGALGTGVGLLVWQLLEWLCRLYVLTDRRVMRISGVLRQSVFDAPLNRVQGVIVHKSIRERLAGLGTVVTTTAATNLGECSWYMVARPAEMADAVRRASARESGGGE